MIIICQNCASRLQVDEERMGSRPFQVRCPKCNQTIEATPPNPALEKSGLKVGASPSTEHPRYEQPKPAPAFEPEPNKDGISQPAINSDNLAQLLARLLGESRPSVTGSYERPSWQKRRALICLPAEQRENVARLLVEDNYQVFVAEDTRQAVERMRENQLEIVLLDPQFDSVEQGAAFVTREINVMRPAQRRRLFFVLISATLRTMDSHAAFLHNVNAVVNINEISQLPHILEHSLREFNELYRDFNNALRLGAI